MSGDQIKGVLASIIELSLQGHMDPNDVEARYLCAMFCTILASAETDHDFDKLREVMHKHNSKMLAISKARKEELRKSKLN